MQGGFTVVRMPTGVYMYSQLFYGNWKLYPAYGKGQVKQFKTEEEIHEYLKKK